MSDKDLTGPMQYSLVWVTIGLCLLLLVAGWYFYVLFSTRKRKEREVKTVVPRLSLIDIKKKYLSLLAQDEAQYREGIIDERTLHQLLSSHIRFFVYEVSGVSTHAFTLDEIKNNNIDHLSSVIEQYYPVEFSLHRTFDSDASIERATRMVNEWT